MANDDNLNPVRSKSEARERGRNGGIKSGESRRNKRDFRTIVDDVFSGKITLTEDETKLYIKLGLTNTDGTVKERIVAGIILNALKGDLPSLKYLLELTGEDPALQLKKEELSLKRKQAQHETVSKNRPIINVDIGGEDGS